MFNEAFRLLKSGGILLDADVIAEEELSIKMQENKPEITKNHYLMESRYHIVMVTNIVKAQNSEDASKFGILVLIIMTEFDSLEHIRIQQSVLIKNNNYLYPYR